MKTSELTGAALDWAVAKCEGLHREDTIWEIWASTHQYSTDWALGGPIIERESINLNKEHDGIHAVIMEPHGHDWTEIVGSTPLIAAMRCYVDSKLGDEVEVPVELA